MIMRSTLIAFALVTAAWATPLDKTSRDTCSPCNPPGATGTNPPSIGPQLDTLYINLLNSVKGIQFQKRWSDSVVQRADGFCCHETLDCVTVVNLNIPMCYDKFTTQYAFADGSWGSLTTGEYNAHQGGKANLIKGNYTTPEGQEGDIYASDPAERPNTATLSIPPQWTGTGIGSAIPPSQIGSIITTAPKPTAASATTTPTGASTHINISPSQASSTGAATQNQMMPFGTAFFGGLMLALEAW